MKKKIPVLLLTLCLCLSLFTLAVGAEDGTGVFGTSMSTFTFVSLIVLGVVIIAVTVLCIVKREKVRESVRAYRSEMKKITWFSWKNVVRCTVFVVVSVVILATVIGLLDIVFFEAQYLLTGKGFRFFGN